MCKSQNWSYDGPSEWSVMLTLGKLHNWLLFSRLRVGNLVVVHRPIGRSHRGFGKWPSLPQAFPQHAAHLLRLCKLKSLQHLPRGAYRNSCRSSDYSSGAIPPSASDSNRVQCLRNAILIRPIGPLRCLAMMISARPCSSGSSCL